MEHQKIRKIYVKQSYKMLLDTKPLVYMDLKYVEDCIVVSIESLNNLDTDTHIHWENTVNRRVNHIARNRILE